MANNLTGVPLRSWTVCASDLGNSSCTTGGSGDDMPRDSTVTVSPSPARDLPRNYTPTTNIPFVESANTPEDPWWDWQAEEDPRVQERVWAAIEALEDTARMGRLVLKNGRHVTLARGLPRLVQKSPDEPVPGLV
ncbi:hypothetical protein EDB85DRAFT_1896494 [Lactarius pseudohatsudake]|nr:hypothetical protein EDB85DRAFT_1896494 [Lactarius pseudohatsudake]